MLGLFKRLFVSKPTMPQHRALIEDMPPLPGPDDLVNVEPVCTVIAEMGTGNITIKGVTPIQQEPDIFEDIWKDFGQCYPTW